MYFIYEALVEDYRKQAKERYGKLQQQHHSGVLGNNNRTQQAIPSYTKQPIKPIPRANNPPKEAPLKETAKQTPPAVQQYAPPSPITILREDNRPLNLVKPRETPKQGSVSSVAPAVVQQAPTPIKPAESNIDRPIPVLSKTVVPASNSIPVPEQQEYPELFECPAGCGRSFNRKALDKHANVCKKVFQQKRKEFVAAEQREIDEAKEIVTTKTKTAQKEDAKLKWKQASLMFRANIKKSKGGTLTKQEQEALKMPDPGLVQCQFCSRRFNQAAAEKHIPACERKSKRH